MKFGVHAQVSFFSLYRGADRSIFPIHVHHPRLLAKYQFLDWTKSHLVVVRFFFTFSGGTYLRSTSRQNCPAPKRPPRQVLFEWPNTSLPTFNLPTCLRMNYHMPLPSRRQKLTSLMPQIIFLFSSLPKRAAQAAYNIHLKGSHWRVCCNRRADG